VRRIISSMHSWPSSTQRFIQTGIDRGIARHRMARARFNQIQVGLARQRLPLALGLGNPLLERLVAQPQKLKSHPREALAAVVRGQAAKLSSLVDDGVQLGLHAWHGVDHAGQIGDVEGVHRAAGRQLEMDGPIDRRSQLIDRGNALFGQHEQPFPVQRHDFDFQRLDIFRQGNICRDAVQRPVRIQLVRGDPSQRAQRDDNHQRCRPDHQFQTGRMVPFGRIVRLRPLALCAIAPGEQKDKKDHRHDDQQHQDRGDHDQLTFLGGQIASRIEQHQLAATGQQADQKDKHGCAKQVQDTHAKPTRTSHRPETGQNRPPSSDEH